MEEPYSPDSGCSTPPASRGSPGSPGGSGAAVPGLQGELLLHLHGFAHGIAEIGNGWEQLAQRVCTAGCVPCVGRRPQHTASSDDLLALASPASPPPQLRGVLPPVAMAVISPQLAVGV